MKKTSSLFLILLTILAFAGCGSAPQEEMEIPEIQTNNDLQQSLTQIQEFVDIEQEVDNTMDLLSKENLTLEDCQTIKLENAKDICEAQFYINEATRTLNLSICEKIRLDYKKSECLEKIQFFMDQRLD